MPQEPQYPNSPQPPSGGNTPASPFLMGAGGIPTLNVNPTLTTALSPSAGLQVIPLPYYANPGSTASDDQEFNIRQFISIVRRRIWVVSGVAALVTLVSWVNALKNQRPVYSGSFRLLIEDLWSNQAADQILTPSAGGGNFSAGDAGRVATQLEVLRSPTLLKPIQTDLVSEYPDLTYEALSQNLKVEQIDGTKVVNVSYQNSDPALVQAVLTHISQAYLSYSSQQQQNALQQGIQFVQSQLPTLQKRVNEKQKELQVFRQRYTLIDPESRGQQLSGLIDNLHSQQQTTAFDLVESRSLYATLQRQVGTSPDIAVASAALSESKSYQTLLGQVQDLESNIAKESARFQMNSPQVQALMEKRSNLVQLMQIEAQRVLGGRFQGTLNDRMTSIPLDLTKQLVDVTNKIQVLQVRQNALSAAEQQLKQEFSLVPQLARQYTDLQRELQIATDSLNRFLGTREQLQIEAAQKAKPWQLVAEPATASTPISPGLLNNLLGGAMVGVALGIVAGLLRDRLDHVFHSVEELKEATRSPILGLIPHNRDIELLQNPAAIKEATPTSPLYKKEAYYSAYSSTPFQEAFRLLYSNIKFLSSDTAIRSITLSSSLSGDGKSTASIYLAQAAAAMGQRVLVVDADMRRPQLHARLGLSNMRGLSNIFANGLDPDDVIQLADANLSILTAGQIPPDPTKLLSSHRMANLIEQFEQSFDLVLYDTPPLLGLADATLLATHTDGLVLVVGLGKTDRSALSNVLDHLKLSAVPLLGLVANGITQSSNYSNGYYYYHYYYQSYYNRSDQAPPENAMTTADHN